MTQSLDDDPLTVWVISDGRRGIENQALGLAEALATFRPIDITRHTITNHGAFKAAQPRMQLALRSKPADYGLPKFLPDIAVGCGRQSIAPLLAIKAARPDIFTAYIQDPKIEPARFDMVIAPAHDDLSARNVSPMIGAPNRITRDQIVKGTVAHQDRLDTLPMPRVAMLIGGTSKTHKLLKPDHDVHMQAAKDALAQGYSVLITASRRTPDWVIADYQKLCAIHDNVWLYDGTGDDNPYFAYLGGAESLLVTEDSTNMLTEACATGKPVFRLPMSGKAGKFKALYDSLNRRCNVTRYAGRFDAPAYPPLTETTRIAEQFWAQYDARGATLN